MTQSDIYAFDHWEGNDVDFSGGATTTDNPETDVVFKSDDATVTAVVLKISGTQFPAIDSSSEAINFYQNMA